MIDLCLEDLETQVIEDMNFYLDSPFIALEVKEAIFQMGALKSPGPNALQALFYQKYWNIVGNDVIEAILNFLNNGDFIDNVNQTFIVLIPKLKALIT